MTDWAALEAKRAPAKRRIGKAIKGGELESPIQRRVVKGLRALGLFVAAIPNGAALGGDRLARIKQNAVLTADGIIDGFPDLVVIGRQGRVGFIEMKRPGGSVSSDQDRVHKNMAERGCNIGFATSLDEALALVKQWGFI